jgi:hypothetical protein
MIDVYRGQSEGAFSNQTGNQVEINAIKTVINAINRHSLTTLSAYCFAAFWKVGLRVDSSG